MIMNFDKYAVTNPNTLERKHECMYVYRGILVSWVTYEPCSCEKHFKLPTREASRIVAMYISIPTNDEKWLTGNYACPSRAALVFTKRSRF